MVVAREAVYFPKPRGPEHNIHLDVLNNQTMNNA